MYLNTNTRILLSSEQWCGIFFCLSAKCVFVQLCEVCFLASPLLCFLRAVNLPAVIGLLGRQGWACISNWGVCPRSILCRSRVGVSVRHNAWQLVYKEINAPVTDSKSEWTDSARERSVCFEMSMLLYSSQCDSNPFPFCRIEWDVRDGQRINISVELCA